MFLLFKFVNCFFNRVIDILFIDVFLIFCKFFFFDCIRIEMKIFEGVFYFF